MTPRDEAMARLADAMMAGTVCTAVEDAARGWIVGQCARIAIDEAVVPALRQHAAQYLNAVTKYIEDVGGADMDFYAVRGRIMADIHADAAIPWDAVCAEESSRG